ncbi:hypothetical protein GC093_23940 [Paenibacillus sp. LMG 31456]|uniref:Uncharacterized protein n=1 Tax=Paenibacillus foliorum TaxID=2654974 RepID=A0A972K3T4_9BACL|nr:hypothetical protein [Paenibacillus foliorum]NOU96248.1 hypothetical protein [Paenibacillus foliorum]
MNTKKKLIIASTLIAILAVSGESVLGSNIKALAEPSAPHSTAGMAKNKAGKDAPKREDGSKRGKAGIDGKGNPCRIEGPDGELKTNKAETAGADATSTNSSAGSVTSGNNSEQATSVVISNGFNTDPQDKGRPVVLIAAALGVPTEVFREAFRGVTPAGLESQPSPELAQRNKAALLKVLAPYGITNERLDEVSNYYRYNGRKGETWKKTEAAATATIVDGVVTGVTITNPGSGYSSNPTVTVTGPNGVITGTATVIYAQDFKTNGSISAIAIN